MLKEAIANAEALFDHPNKQYVLFKDLDEMVAKKATPDVPDRFTDRPRAQAYYGAFLDQLGGQAVEKSEDDLVAEAMYIDDTVDNAVQTHSINPGSIEAEINKVLLPRYFKFFGGLDDAKSMIDRVIGIVRAGKAKGN